AGGGVYERCPAGVVHVGTPCTKLLCDLEMAAQRRNHERSVPETVAYVDVGAAGEERFYPRGRSVACGDDKHRLAIGVAPIRIGATREQRADVGNAIVGDGDTELVGWLLGLR